MLSTRIIQHINTNNYARICSDLSITKLKIPHICIVLSTKVCKY
eukprot:UN08762